MNPCVHELVGRHAVSTPAATAVRFEDRHLSYRDLMEQVNRLAHLLAKAEVGAGSIVGVRLPRSPELVVALLGVLTSGAAYLPLAIDDPPDRLRELVDDAGADPVITEQWFGDNASALANVSAKAAEPVARADDLAYVIYTSGSTGSPKGVMVEHRQLTAYVQWAATAYQRDGAGAILHSSPAHDLSVTALYTPLVTGQTLTLVPETTGAAAMLPGLAADRELAFLKVTPAHLPVLADAARPGQRWPSRLVVGGDVLTADALRHWADHAPDVLVVNEYGPTEATVGCSAHEFRAGATGAGPVSLGSGIAGTHLYVLDEDLVDTDSGELFVGGPLVTRGYLGRPEVTAAAYLPDPFSPEPGARMYRTGDLVRRTSSDELEFVGRADRQLKIRGFRVHPAEVEAALCMHTNIASASVDLQQRAGRGWLVAHLVAAQAPVPTSDEVRAHLSGRVPSHMIPDELCWLPELPLTTNGKVDRDALSSGTSASAAVLAARPRTPTESAVAEVFEDLLGYPPADLDTDFTALGGDSVGAAQLIARLSRTYDVDIPMDLWHLAPTVTGLARLIDTYQRDGRDAAIALHEHPDLDGYSLDNEILTALEIGASNGPR